MVWVGHCVRYNYYYCAIIILSCEFELTCGGQILLSGRLFVAMVTAGRREVNAEMFFIPSSCVITYCSVGSNMY